MTISIVQAAGNANGVSQVSTLAVTFGAGTGTGNCVIATAGAEATIGITVSTIKLGTVDTLAKVVAVGGGAGQADNEQWIDVGATSAQTAVNYTWSTSGNVTGVAFEATGLRTSSSPVDKTNSNLVTSGTTSFTSNATGTLTSANELVIGSVMAYGVVSTTITGPSSPWTNQAQQNSGSAAGKSLMSGSQVVSATTSLSYAGTFNQSVPYAATIASYLAPGVNVSIPVVQTTDNVPALNPTTNVGLTVVATTDNVPALTPVIPVLVNLPVVSTKDNVPLVTPTQPPQLIIAIVPAFTLDPLLGETCDVGYSVFTVGNANALVNMSNQAVNFQPDQGVSVAASILCNTAGQMEITSGGTSGGDTQGQLFVDSAAHGGGNTFVNVACQNLVVNGTTMNVP
jgi:hypothetical protein